jgi:flagellar protein FliO/FliZ
VRRIVFSVASALLALPVTLARAEGPPAPADGYYLRDYQEIAQTAPQQPWYSLTFDLVVKLGLVIGLIYLTMWALKRFVVGPQARGGAPRLAGRLEVLDTTHLAPNRTVYLVEVADRVLVLGATQSTLSTLAEIKEPGAIDLLKARPAEEAAASPSFADQFQKLTASLTSKAPAAASAEPSSPTAFLQDKIGELRSLSAQLRRPSEESTTP